MYMMTLFLDVPPSLSRMPENVYTDIVPTFHSKDPKFDIRGDEHNISAESKQPCLLESLSHRMILNSSDLDYSSLLSADSWKRPSAD